MGVLAEDDFKELEKRFVTQEEFRHTLSKSLEALRGQLVDDMNQIVDRILYHTDELERDIEHVQHGLTRAAQPRPRTR